MSVFQCNCRSYHARIFNERVKIIMNSGFQLASRMIESIYEGRCKIVTPGALGCLPTKKLETAFVFSEIIHVFSLQWHCANMQKGTFGDP